MSQTKRTIAFSIAALTVIGCNHKEPAPVATIEPAPLVTDVVAKKPFIALPHPFKPVGAQPSLLLRLHARTDSPVSLAEYDKQKSFPLSAFKLSTSLSALDLQKLGLPAQLADYSDPWFVYRLNYGKELWLHFSQPDNLQLLSADVVAPAEDGYTRDRVFSVDGSR